MFRVRLPIPRVNLVKRGDLVPSLPKVRKPRSAQPSRSTSTRNATSSRRNAGR